MAHRHWEKREMLEEDEDDYVLTRSAEFAML